MSPSCDLPLYSLLTPFHSTELIKPDVTIVTTDTGFPVLTVEVYSRYWSETVKKTLIGVINHFRILRAHNTSIMSCTGFAFPKKGKCSCVAKITVSFVDFAFVHTIEYLTNKDDVAGTITQVLEGNWFQNPIPVPPDIHFQYFIRLSQQECDYLQSNLAPIQQVESQNSILLRTTNGTKYFKNHIDDPTTQFTIFASIEFTRITYLGPATITNSLLPECSFQCGEQTFYQYEGLVEPYSRGEAKEHLIALLEGVCIALTELHNPPPPPPPPPPQSCTP